MVAERPVRFVSGDADRLRIALTRIARQVDRQVSGDGMTPTQLSVLSTVARLGPLGLGELADLEGLNPTMLSRVVGKLEASGLLSRTASEADRRAVRVGITAAGQALQHRLRRQRSQLFARRLAGLPAEQVADLVAALPALETLAEHLTRPQSAPRPAAQSAPRPAAQSAPRPAAQPATPSVAQPAASQPVAQPARVGR